MSKASLAFLATATLALTLTGIRLVSSPASTEEKTIETTTAALTNTAVSTAPKSRLSLKELDLSDDRQVFVYGPIDEVNSPVIAKQLLELGKSSKPLTVVLNSPGGSVFDGAAIISAMEAARGPVNTLCVQLCASMAAMIHQYGTHRLMLNRSVLMFHPAAGGLQGTIDQMNSRLTLFKSFIGKMEQNVATRSHTTFEAYKARAGVELWIDAEDSVNQGFADQIVFVRGSSAAKLYRESADMKIKHLPAVTPNIPSVDQPSVVPVIPKLVWF